MKHMVSCCLCLRWLHKNKQGFQLINDGRFFKRVGPPLSTINDVDCIYVLDKGRIVETGAFSQLTELKKG